MGELLGQLAVLDGDRREARGVVEEAFAPLVRVARAIQIQRHHPEEIPVAGPHRRRPAPAQPLYERGVAEQRPLGVARDVARGEAALELGPRAQGGGQREHFRPQRLRKFRRRIWADVAQRPVLEQCDRSRHPGHLPLGHPAQAVQDRIERLVAGDHLQHVAPVVLQPFRLLALRHVLYLCDEVQRPALLVAHQRDAQQRPDHVAELVEVALGQVIAAHLAGHELAH